MRQNELTRAVIDAMSSVFYGVYYVSLEEDEVIVYREADVQSKNTVDEARNYTVTFEKYIDQYVCTDDQERVAQFCDVKTIGKRLEGKTSISIEYYRKELGWSRGMYIPVQIDETGKITYVIFLERLVQERNENMSQTSALNRNEVHQDITKLSILYKKDENELIVNAMNRVYFTSFYILIRENRYKMFKCSAINGVEINEQGNAKSIIQQYVNTVVSAEYQSYMREFMDVDSMAERLKNKEFIEQEYLSNTYRGWCQARLIPVRRDADGNVLTCIFAISSVDQEKRNFQEQMLRQKMYKELPKHMFHIQMVFCGIVSIDSGEVSVFDIKEDRSKFETRSVVTFEELKKRVLDNYVVEYDKSIFEKSFSIDYIVDKLSETKQYEFVISQMKRDCEVGRFEYHMSYISDEKNQFVCVVDEITAREEKDYITDGLNLQGFLRRAERIIKKENVEYSILHFDIQGFKAINDRIGYDLGNILLKECYHLLMTSELHPVLAARDSADHFYCLVERDNLDYIKLTRFCNNTITYEDFGATLQVHCGIYHVEDRNLSVRSMCDKARLAEEKVNHAESVKPYYVFTNDLNNLYLQQKNILNTLELAIESGQFQAYYQPIVDAKTERIVAAEALVRWIAPDNKIISPAVFVPILEENRQISKVDFVIFKQVKKWVQTKFRNKQNLVPVSVNLSQVDLINEEMLGELVEEAKNMHETAEYLRFEITESTYADIAEYGESVLQTLRNEGHKLLIDDFGSGYSSFRSLTDREFDIVKLDMSYVSQIGKNQRVEKIISTIVEMTHSLNAKVVAEGVETREQIEFLKKEKCDFFQGYYFSKPLAEADFESLLELDRLHV